MGLRGDLPPVRLLQKGPHTRSLTHFNSVKAASANCTPRYTDGGEFAVRNAEGEYLRNSGEGLRSGPPSAPPPPKPPSTSSSNPSAQLQEVRRILQQESTFASRRQSCPCFPDDHLNEHATRSARASTDYTADAPVYVVSRTYRTSGDGSPIVSAQSTFGDTAWSQGNGSLTGARRSQSGWATPVSTDRGVPHAFSPGPSRKTLCSLSGACTPHNNSCPGSPHPGPWQPASPLVPLPPNGSVPLPKLPGTASLPKPPPQEGAHVHSTLASGADMEGLASSSNQLQRPPRPSRFKSITGMLVPHTASASTSRATSPPHTPRHGGLSSLRLSGNGDGPAPPPSLLDSPIAHCYDRDRDYDSEADPAFLSSPFADMSAVSLFASTLSRGGNGNSISCRTSTRAFTTDLDSLPIAHASSVVSTSGSGAVAAPAVSPPRTPGGCLITAHFLSRLLLLTYYAAVLVADIDAWQAHSVRQSASARWRRDAGEHDGIDDGMHYHAQRSVLRVLLAVVAPGAGGGVHFPLLHTVLAVPCLLAVLLGWMYEPAALLLAGRLLWMLAAQHAKGLLLFWLGKPVQLLRIKELAVVGATLVAAARAIPVAGSGITAAQALAEAEAAVASKVGGAAAGTSLAPDGLHDDAALPAKAPAPVLAPSSLAGVTGRRRNSGNGSQPGGIRRGGSLRRESSPVRPSLAPPPPSLSPAPSAKLLQHLEQLHEKRSQPTGMAGLLWHGRGHLLRAGLGLMAPLFAYYACVQMEHVRDMQDTGSVAAALHELLTDTYRWVPSGDGSVNTFWLPTQSAMALPFYMGLGQRWLAVGLAAAVGLEGVTCWRFWARSSMLWSYAFYVGRHFAANTVIAAGLLLTLPAAQVQVAAGSNSMWRKKSR